MIINAKGPASFAEKYIVRSIWDNKFPPGSILPAERELSELIGVTRTTLREVLQRLARDGWLKIQHGKPTQVNNFWETSGLNILETIADLNPDGFPLLVDQLMSARANVSTIYFRASFRHNPEKAQEILSTVHLLSDDAEAYADFDYRLHHTLAFASGNPLYVLILNGFKGLYSRVGRYYFSSKDARKLAFNFYVELEKLARDKNYQAVPALMRLNGIESGKMWQKLRDDMPAEIAHDNS
ncbi:MULTISPECIES: fatty acid metabolism transcriptional regulator FadR [Shewanella]|jgi:GntR family negative regulator for fad regulon and positive regulator of fabA|uniref:Fatty acid metabolism regulator protein n=1 Tax=Shewanella holmiensis TaxID=2952222 RepID=A0A9X2WJ31_9GAMM|nr:MULTISPECIES: fatty acid metabolism transcriptional regulator FadR [Shewanella]MCT7940288.1 fatty acid metabolism transcriptional regulator FadR [Shewanella holmiensis]MDP5147080.1 fatty acid metabolism transcriptional regulator FadR [Shewanella sp. ULN5]